MATMEIGNHGEHGIWPSLEVATWWFDRASMVLAVSLLFSFAATVVIVWLGIVKEHHWQEARESAALKIAELNNETARLNIETTRNAGAARVNEMRALSNKMVSEVIAIQQGVERKSVSEAARSFGIIEKIKTFAGMQFDVVVTSSDLELSLLGTALGNSLEAAGWIEIALDEGVPQINAGGAALIAINVDLSKGAELSDAANSLASALNAEGIVATVEAKADTANADVIHIVVSPKP